MTNQIEVFTSTGRSMKVQSGLLIPAGSHLLVDGKWSVVDKASRIEIKREFESMTQSWVRSEKVVEV